MNNLKECCKLLENQLKEDYFDFIRLSDSEFKISFIDGSEYTVFIYWYSISSNELGVSLRDEYNTNLYDYVCASQGVPMGSVTDRTVDGIVSKVMNDLYILKERCENEED